MEAIKCPNCGSEKVKELTEEKYACLACDNVFLVHNLSKEFRMTDEHITGMHSDITRKLDEIKKVADTGDATILKKQAINAELLLKEDLLGAYEAYREYAMLESDSAVGYEGMFRAMTDDYNDDPASYVKASDVDDPDLYNDLYDGFDVLVKALNCKDVARENLLNKVLTRHKYSAKHLVNKALFGDDDEFDSSEMHSLLCELITGYEKDIQQAEVNLQENNKKIDEYKNLPKENKIKKIMLLKIPALVLGIIALILDFGFLKILFGIAAVACLFVIKAKPRDMAKELIKSMEENKDILGRLLKAKKMIEDVDALTIDDMEKIIHENHTKGDSIEEMYVGLREAVERRIEEERLEAERQAEIEEGYFQVSVENWGCNRKLVRDILREHCTDKKYIDECYKNNYICKINGFRKSAARQLQEELMSIGAVAIIKNI